MYIRAKERREKGNQLKESPYMYHTFMHEGSVSIRITQLFYDLLCNMKGGVWQLPISADALRDQQFICSTWL